MDTLTADGVRLVPPDEIPALVESVVVFARDFVLLAGIPLHGAPGRDAALRRAARCGCAVRIVVTPAQLQAAVREVDGLLAEGASVFVSSAPVPAFVATEDAAFEAPTAFDDVPRAAGPAVLVLRADAGGRWARIVARAKIAQLATRRVTSSPFPRPVPSESWRATFRELFRS